MNQNISRIYIVPAMCSVLLSACATSDPARVEEDFGKSVRSMVEQQKYTNDSVLVVPMTGSRTGLDGDSAINSLEQYREAQKRKQERESLDSIGSDE